MIFWAHFFNFGHISVNCVTFWENVEVCEILDITSIHGNFWENLGFHSELYIKFGQNVVNLLTLLASKIARKI